MITASPEIRAHIHALRRALSDNQLHAHSAGVLERLQEIGLARMGQHIASYISVHGEMVMQPVVDYLWSLGKTVYLPVVEGETMWFCPWREHEPLAKKAFGLYEPSSPRSQWRNGEDMDVVLAPLVAFDDSCQRIGMGGGYYDRSFSIRLSGVQEPRLIGIAHELQKTGRIHAQLWDVPMDWVVTEAAIYRNPRSPLDDQSASVFP